MKKLLALVYGVLAYAFFFCTFLYAIAFIGNVAVPKTIDTGAATALPRAVVVDAVLLSLFALQHSIMARQGFKRAWTRLVSPHLERTTFVLAASGALALLLWQWRPIPAPVWDVRGTALGTALAGAFWLGWGLLLLATFLIDHFELFGLRQVWAYARGREFHGPEFKTPGLYRLVRHPIYLGFVIAFWSTPLMSMGHLMFSVMTTGYILVGICFEERDLIAAYGQRYREYRARVPMLIPLLKTRRGNESPRGGAKGRTTAG